jgi:DNA repair protein SbcD/Mre11
VKLLHTADWHAGRSLHGLDRTPEIREVLREIAELAKSEAVDLVLVAGDIYDNKNPGADAETAVYEFFLELHRAQIPSVVIAGNHDSPSRLEAVKHLLKLTQVQVLGQPQVAGQGGVFDIPLGGEVARVAALPFVSERRIIKVAELLDADPGQWLERYQEGMRRLLHNVTASFSSEQVNLLVMHATMDGATLSQSEYTFHSTDTYALRPDIFPQTVNYVALGHIHKAQGIKHYPDYAGRYAGSILQLDFGEQGDGKFVYLLEAKAGRPSEILKEIPLRAGKRLKRLSLDIDTLDRKTAEIKSFDGWLKLALKLEHPRPGLKDRLMSEFANVLAVEVELPEVPETSSVNLEQLSLIEAYAQYYQTRRGQSLPAELEAAFKNLLEQEPDEVVA